MNREIPVEFAPEDAPDMTGGLWRCRSCSCLYFGGGPKLHNLGCDEAKKEEREQAVAFVATPKYIKLMLRLGEHHPGPYWNITVAHMRRYIPDQVAAIEREAESNAAQQDSHE